MLKGAQRSHLVLLSVLNTSQCYPESAAGGEEQSMILLNFGAILGYVVGDGLSR